MVAMKGLGGQNEREDKALPLVGNAGALLRIRRVGILHRRRTSRHQRILSIVDGVRESVGQHEINSAGHAAANGKSGAVIDARGRALKNIDRPQAAESDAPAD